MHHIASVKKLEIAFPRAENYYWDDELHEEK
jgi:hypothetical protein